MCQAGSKHLENEGMVAWFKEVS